MAVLTMANRFGNLRCSAKRSASAPAISRTHFSAALPIALWVLPLLEKMARATCAALAGPIPPPHLDIPVLAARAGGQTQPPVFHLDTSLTVSTGMIFAKDVVGLRFPVSPRPVRRKELSEKSAQRAPKSKNPPASHYASVGPLCQRGRRRRSRTGD